MKKSIIIIAVFIMIGTGLIAQNTATTNAAAKILSALTIQKNVDLNFGTMTMPTAATQVNLTAGGVRTTPGNITLLAQAPLATASAYSVSGDNGATYAITLPSSCIITAPYGWMQVDNFTTSKVGNISTLNASNGTDSFTVGATLEVNFPQYAGSYSGTFDVSVAYN